MADTRNGTVTVEQIGSPIRREGKQRQTLIGLGLNKLRRTSTLADTSADARHDRGRQAPRARRRRGER